MTHNRYSRAFDVTRAMIEGRPLLDVAVDLIGTEECSTCEGGGWVYSSYQARGGPNFDECPDCYNPLGLRSP